MEIKTTSDIIDDQFEKKLEIKSKRTITLNQPRDDLMEYRAKKWIAVDDLLEKLGKFSPETPLNIIVSELHDEGLTSQSNRKRG